MSGFAEVLHALVDVAAGRRNLSPADADQLHEAVDAPAPAAETVTDQGPPEPGPGGAGGGE